jgi:hypothetical protein
MSDDASAYQKSAPAVKKPSFEVMRWSERIRDNTPHDALIRRTSSLLLAVVLNSRRQLYNIHRWLTLQAEHVLWIMPATYHSKAKHSTTDRCKSCFVPNKMTVWKTIWPLWRSKLKTAI